MRCYPVGSAVNSCEGTPAAGGVARRVRQAAAVGLIAIFAAGCAVSNRIALPPLPQVDVLVLLQASLGPGGAGQAYPVQTISTNLTSAGSAILSACGFVSPPGTAPGNNVVPRGLQITVGTPPGGATNTGCTISGRIDSAVAPGTYVFTVRAADNNAPPQVDDETYSIVVSSLLITLGPNPASTVTGETFAVTWSFTVVGSPANPNQSAIVELVNAANVVEDSCTAAIGAGGCGGLASPAVGNKTIRLTYPAPGQADPNFPAGGGANRAHTVTAASTTTTITADAPDPSVTGQQYTVNVTVAPVAPGAGAPTGNVSVSDGLGNNCVAALTPGANQSTGSCLLNGPTAGGRTLTASYAGDANYSASVGTDAHTVNPAPTTTTITSDVADPSVVGEAYTINVTVAVNAPGAGTPTGVVATNDGQGVMCNATLAAGPGANQASGSCSLTSVTTAANLLTANYPGDANFAPSNDSEGHTVTPAPTTAKINSIVPAASVGFSVSGESYTVSFEVSSTAGVGEPTGTVTVDDGSGQSCSSALTPGAPGSGASTGGCALVSASASGPGPAKTITATYPSPPAAGSDPNFIGSSGTAAHTVNPADTATVNVSSSGLVGGIRTSQFQESVTFTATVTIVAPGSATPVGLSGTVDFVNITAVPATNLCIGVALTAGMATCVVSNLATLAPTGLIHSIEARYDTGNTDLNFNSSTGTERQQVVPAATQTAVASSVNPSTSPQAVTFTATVTVPGPGSGSPIAPTGTVAFFDGSTPFLGCVAQTLSSGQAACTVPNALDLVALSAGPHSITAAYSGDTNFATSASPVLVQMVNTAPTITPIVLGDGVEDRAVGAGSSGLAGVRFPISGGTPPYVCSDPGGTLPAGISVVLAVTGADCELQGTPSAGASAGSPYSVDITVTDANTASDTTGPITWDINPPLMITDPATLADAVEDRNYSFTFNSTMLGGNGPYTWSESGASLGSADCAGFSIVANGDLTGTQPLVAGGGTCMFTVQVADTASTTTMAGSATQAETIVVQPMLTIVTTNLANALRNSVYLPTGQPGEVVQSTGGTGTPFTYDVSAGNFVCLAGTCTGIATTPCQGLSFAQTAVDAGSGAAVDTIIAGTPVNAGACSLTIRVTDGGSGPTASGSATQALTIQVLDNFVYVADPANDQINVLRVDTTGGTADTEITTNPPPISTGAGTDPHSIAITPDGSKAFITLQTTNQFMVINTITNTVIGSATTFANCTAPRGIDIGRAGAALNVAFVGCGNDRIATINTNTNMEGAEVTGIPAGNSIHYIAVAPDGSAAFASRNSRNALRINTSTLAATETTNVAGGGGMLRGVAVSADGARVYFADSANNEVVVVSAANLATGIDCVPGGTVTPCAMGVGSAPEGLALSLNGSFVFAALNGNGSFGVINEGAAPTVNTTVDIVTNSIAAPTGATCDGAGALATITTTAAHGLATGNVVRIAGVSDASFNGGPFTITVTGATTFTYAVGCTANVMSGNGSVSFVGSGPFGVALPPGAARAYFTLNAFDSVARHADSPAFASSGALLNLTGTAATTPRGTAAIHVPR